ncbi:hypothetical protein DBL07_25905 [Achromobacter mucicolens]|uniref:hypothetical protein n=1 Tax=Achromobacter mucicolens TaxID=1389922 RepID=UPI000D4582C9|nr:hypothetical protein [Achromobacter mucicolens]PTW84009.1 hypothetical protein DBL07_25905 [Achromobacter mucicolens]
MTTTHTEGPWRWEFNAEHRSVQLVGGKPQYDLTVMDFTRWGMAGAGIRLRELSERGMNLLHKLHERPDWIAPFPGREHHKHWRADVIHPDMRLIAAAPELLAALESCVIWNGKRGPDDNLLPIDRQPGEIAKAMRAVAKAKGEQQ